MNCSRDYRLWKYLFLWILDHFWDFLGVLCLSHGRGDSFLKCKWCHWLYFHAALWPEYLGADKSQTKWFVQPLFAYLNEHYFVFQRVERATWFIFTVGAMLGFLSNKIANINIVLVLDSHWNKYYLDKFAHFIGRM